jgi:hypothetical protein
MPSTPSTSDERLDDPQDEIGQFVDRSDHEPALKYFNVAERYIEGRLLVLVFLRVTGESHKYVALFRYADGINEWNRYGLVLGNSEGRGEIVPEQFVGCCRIEPVTYAAGTVYLCKDQDMLVRNIHPVKTPKGIVPTEVRLETVDKLLVSDARTIYFSRSVGRIALSTLQYWERGIGAYGPSIVRNESRNEMVQSGAEIVDNIANDQADDGINLNEILDDVVGESGLRIVFGADFAGICPQKGFSSRFEICDVAFGPLDL